MLREGRFDDVLGPGYGEELCWVADVEGLGEGGRFGGRGPNYKTCLISVMIATRNRKSRFDSYLKSEKESG